jgi:AraC-like DNA-binding protein
MSRPMLISLRRFSVPELDVSIERSILRHPSFVVRLADYRGSIVEDRLFAASAVGTTAVPHWPLLALVLAGSGIMRTAPTSAIVQRGDLVFVPSGAGFSARSDPSGARVWILQWDPEVFGGAGAACAAHHRLPPSDFERVQAPIQRSVAAGHAVSDCAMALVEVFAALRSFGLVDAQPAASDLLFSVPAPLVRVGIAIDSALSNLSRAPASIDLERSLACSPAQLRRLIHRHGTAAISPAPISLANLTRAAPPTWRDLLNGWRLAVGVLLMTSPKSRTERVAAQLGYSSPTSFCHAFANAALPSPGNVRRAVDGLA